MGGKPGVAEPMTPQIKIKNRILEIESKYK
jgi:hypothetical protein